jgi:peroxiredoxin
MNHLSLFRQLCFVCFLLAVSACSQPMAPDINFTDLKGNQFSLTQLRGKIVIVNFWATSCSTCVTEMPHMIETYGKYHARGLELIAVAMSYDPPNYVINFTETRKLPFPVTLDVEGNLARAFDEVKLTPTTFVIDQQGQIIKKYVGVPDFEQLYRLLDERLLYLQPS